MLGLVTLTVFLISYPSFAASVGLHHSKWVPVGVYLDPLFIRPPLCNPPITGKLKSLKILGCSWTLTACKPIKTARMTKKKVSGLITAYSKQAA